MKRRIRAIFGLVLAALGYEAVRRIAIAKVEDGDVAEGLSLGGGGRR